MSAGIDTEVNLSAVPLVNAVFCADCETISNSPHDACTICGSHSLTSLFRMLGGTVRSQKLKSTEHQTKTAKYNLELTAKVDEIPANELNHVIEFVTWLAKVCGDVKSLHINVESVLDVAGVLKAA